MKERMEAPVYKGEIVGELIYTLNNEIIKKYEIKAGETVKNKDFDWAIRCTINKFVMH